MTTSPTSDWRIDRTRVPDRTLWFYRGRLQEQLYDLIVREFDRQEDAGEITRTALASRLGRRREQITRWLAAPSNMTLDTISDLLVGLRVPPELTITGLPVAPMAGQAIEEVVPVPALDQAAQKQPARSDTEAATLVRLVSTRTAEAAEAHRAPQVTYIYPTASPGNRPRRDPLASALGEGAHGKQAATG